MPTWPTAEMMFLDRRMVHEDEDLYGDLGGPVRRVEVGDSRHVMKPKDAPILDVAPMPLRPVGAV